MFRLFTFWLKSFFIKSYINAGDVSRIFFRVMPWDCDPNMHMTNSRYFAYMDYARFWRLTHMGVFKEIMLKNRWMPMAVSQEITYIRDIAPFEKFEVHTQLAGWDEKYLYIAQDFYGKKGLCAKAMVRGLFLKNKQAIPTDEILKIFKHSQKIERFQERIDTWKKVLDLKKAES